MAVSPSELDYTTIDRPYDGSLNRAVSEAKVMGTPSLLQGGADPTGNGASVNPNNKVVASGTEFDDVWMNTWIKSKNYLPKSRGFFIDAMAGYIEGMNVFVSGDITASTGSIGGFVIGADYLRDLANSFGLASTVTSADDVRFWAGTTFANRVNAPFRITEAGVLTAQSGTIGGWTITSTTLTATGIILDAGNQKITVGSATPNIIIDGVNKNVRTSTYASGTAGWSITKDGDAEFNDITARGEFHTQVLSYGSVHVTAGSNLLALSGGTLKFTISSIDNGGSAALESSVSDVILLESGTTDELLLEDSVSLAINDPPTGHTQVFSVNDRLRIKDGSGNDNWFTVVSVVDATTYYSYTCTKSSGSNATFYAGAAVSDYGQSGQGLIFSTVDSVNSPYISVQTHAGSPWSAITEQVRMGNLNGFLDYATNIYGFAVGSSAGTDANITIDPTNGIRIRSGTTNVMSIDNAGNATFSGSITATTGSIGGFNIGSDYIRDAANSFGLASTVTGGDDIRFWAGAAFASRATAPLRITEAGAIVASSATITGALTTASGSSLDGTYLTTASVTSTKTNLAMRGWTQTSAFSASDADTVAWGAGTFTASDGTAYSITGSNTGNMAAKTYIYLDIGVSTTAYQTTTTAGTAVGDGKVLIAVAQNNTGEATFQVFGGGGGINIDAASIVASSITANEIAAGAVTATKINVSSLSAISANLGTITAGTITLSTSGFIRGGQTDYNTGSGFFLGYSGSAYKLSIGDSTTSNSLTWDGSLLSVNGSTVSGNDVFGSGADGAFALDGTNDYPTYMSKSGSNYTLLKDVFATTFTMSGSATLTTDGYRLFAKTSLSLGASNVIKWNGQNGGNGGNAAAPVTGGTAGAAGVANTSTNLYGGVAGVIGRTGSAGDATGGLTGTTGASVSRTFNLTAHSVSSGAGGAGGADGIGQAGGAAGAAGAAGSLTSTASVRPYSAAFGVRMYDELPGSSLAYLTYQNGVGSAGSGGSGNSGCIGATGGPAGGSGGSGSSGGTIVICARIITNAGSITATGGTGGNGGNGADGLGGAFCGGGGHGAGGGGGGGGATGGPGGIIMMIYSSLSGAGTITAAGGAGGSGGSPGAGGIGTGGGSNGFAGSSGSAGTTGPSGVVVQLVV